MLRQTLRATRSQLQEMSLRSLVFAEEYSKRCFSSSGGRLRKIKLRSFQGGGGGSSARSHRATRMTIDKTPSVQPSAAPASRLDKKEFAHGVAIISLSTLSFTVNIPLGSVRSGFDSFGMEWWLTLGAAVPFCALVHWRLKLPWYNIPCCLLAIAVGQAAGAYLLPKSNGPKALSNLIPPHPSALQQDSEVDETTAIKDEERK